MTAAELIDFFQYRSTLLTQKQVGSCCKSLPVQPSEVDKIMICDNQPVPLNHGPKGASGMTESLGPMTYIKVYKEKYLLAHSVVEGKFQMQLFSSVTRFGFYAGSSTKSCKYTGNN
jgi:hypothetical protein